MLLALINNLSDDFVAEISSVIGPKLKKTLKIPGILMAFCGAILAGTSLVMAKCGGEILQGEEAAEYGLLSICFYTVSVLIAGM